MQAGMDVWHHETNVTGATVELHGNIRHLVCPECHHLLEVDESDLVLLRKRKTRQCQVCGKGTLRFKIMLYDDEEAEAITPENVWDQLETDLETADLIVWVGMSFEQVRSAAEHLGAVVWAGPSGVRSCRRDPCLITTCCAACAAPSIARTVQCHSLLCQC